MMREVLRGCVSFVWLILLPALASAQAEVKVFVGGAMTPSVKEAGAAFERSSGHKLVYVSDTTGALQKRLAAGEKADLIIVAGPAMDTLQKENRVVAGSRVDLARALIGVGVRAGAASPDLSTPDTFKAALLNARSVSYVNPASGWNSARRDPVADDLFGGDRHDGRARRRGARLPSYARRHRGPCGADESRARTARSRTLNGGRNIGFHARPQHQCGAATTGFAPGKALNSSRRPYKVT